MITQKQMDDKFIQGNIKGLLLQEVLEGIQSITTRQKKIQALQANESPLLMFTLKTILDKNIQMTITPTKAKETIKKYRAKATYMDPSMAPASIKSRIKTIRRFIQTDPFVLNEAQTEDQIISFVNLFTQEDTDIMQAMFTKKMPYKSITIALVNKAFPDLIPVEETK